MRAPRPAIPGPALMTLCGLLGLVFVGIGLTTYTTSVFNPGPAQVIEEILHRALGDRLPTIAPWSEAKVGLKLSRVASSTFPTENRADSTPERWARGAVEQDSTAVRGWLSPFTLRWAFRLNDSLHVSFLRLSRQPGCPLISRLDGILTGTGEAVVRIKATCPPAADADPAAATH
jgi:hypothetical protein